MYMGDELYRVVTEATEHSNIAQLLYAYQESFGRDPAHPYHVDVTIEDDDLTMLLQKYNGKQTRGKPARVIKQVIPKGLASILTDVDYEDFVNVLKAHYLKEGFEIREHERSEIPALMLDRNYATDTDVGTLNRSCMRYDHNQPALRLLTTIPELSILVLHSPQQGVAARALLWRIGGETIMDRVYGSESSIRMLINHAKGNGWWFRTHQGFDMTPYYENPRTGRAETLNLEVRLPEWPDNNQLPYFDTFSYLDLDTRELRTDGGHLLLHSTSGEYSVTDAGYQDAPACESCGDPLPLQRELIRKWFLEGKEGITRRCGSCRSGRRRMGDVPEADDGLPWRHSLANRFEEMTRAVEATPFYAAFNQDIQIERDRSVRASYEPMRRAGIFDAVATIDPGIPAGTNTLEWGSAYNYSVENGTPRIYHAATTAEVDDPVPRTHDGDDDWLTDFDDVLF